MKLTLIVAIAVLLFWVEFGTTVDGWLIEVSIYFPVLFTSPVAALFKIFGALEVKDGVFGSAFMVTNFLEFFFGPTCKFFIFTLGGDFVIRWFRASFPASKNY